MSLDLRDNLRKLMMRAGISSIRRLAAECAKIVPPRVGVKKRDAMSVGRNLIASMLINRARVISFDQIVILCRALNCTPNHLLGFEPIPGFDQGQDQKKLERMETQMVKLQDALMQIAKTDTPVGKAVAEILKQH